MPAFTATAPGKIILFGEHAVVYGYPAIAVPVNQLRARATVSANLRAKHDEIRIQAPDIGIDALIQEMPAEHPLSWITQEVLSTIGARRCPPCIIKITSTIPIASGMGSGAAISVAIARAFSAFLGHPLPDEQVSALSFETEKLYHGTPSGIDNTVITYAQPVYFVRGQPINIIKVGKPFTMIIGDTGVASPTSVTVGEVRQLWQSDPAHYDNIFQDIGNIAQSAHQAIENGEPEALGPLLNQNHTLLQALNVSSPELDHLVETARTAGALGAKLSGGGRGGNMIALVEPGIIESVSQGLKAAGAKQVIVTEVGR